MQVDQRSRTRPAECANYFPRRILPFDSEAVASEPQI